MTVHRVWIAVAVLWRQWLGRRVALIEVLTMSVFLAFLTQAPSLPHVIVVMKNLLGAGILLILPLSLLLVLLVTVCLVLVAAEVQILRGVLSRMIVTVHRAFLIFLE